nr:hypothetical protein 13 [Legionellales bacterium]
MDKEKQLLHERMLTNWRNFGYQITEAKEPPGWPKGLSQSAFGYISSMLEQAVVDEGKPKLTAQRLSIAISEDSGVDVDVSMSKKFLKWYKGLME